jgi:KRAB domain-containing zinc finger protein
MKRYLCGFCGKDFNDSSVVKKHLRKHTGLRPYKCTECESQYVHLKTLQNHLKNVHQKTYDRPKIFVCELCGFIAYSYRDYAQHKLIHNAELFLLKNQHEQKNQISEKQIINEECLGM